MVFMDPKTDIAFKKLFSNKEKKEIVVSFLNSVLEKKEGEKIVDVTINDPNNIPESITSKFSIVDVSCTDQAGKNYIVEMQVIDQKDYAERCQYYASLGLLRQLIKGDDYNKLKPVIFVGVICFNLFKDTNYLSHHLILNQKTHTHGLTHLEFHFIELNKFNKTINQLKTVTDKWIYLLKNADNLNDIPSALEKPVELEEAMDILKKGNWSRGELEAYDKYWDYVRTEKSRYETALEKGMQKGMEKGLEKGKKQAMTELASRLLKNYKIDEVAKITNLSVDELKKLK
jgi:predicted transposase/invertase (TIGR01784 family)